VNTHSQLKREAKIYKMLSGEGKAPIFLLHFDYHDHYISISITAGVPKIRWLGEGENRNFMVMDLLGRSLEFLFNFCNRRFTLKTVLVIAYELLCRIETVHRHGKGVTNSCCIIVYSISYIYVGKLVHRDIKPENFLMGLGRDRHTVYLIDYGLAKHYLNPKTQRHIPCKSGYSLTGTARYASINAHLGHGNWPCPFAAYLSLTQSFLRFD
jgi:serine/threonine protein kinase